MLSIKNIFLPMSSAIHIDAMRMGESVMYLEVTGSNVQLLLNNLSCQDPDENCHILWYFIWVFTVYKSTSLWVSYIIGVTYIYTI